MLKRVNLAQLLRLPVTFHTLPLFTRVKFTSVRTLILKSRTQRSVLGLRDTTTCTGGPCHRLFSLSKFLLWNGIRRLPKTDFESYQPSDQKSSSWKFIFFIVNHYVVRIFVCVRLFRRRFFSRYLTDFSQKCLLYRSVDGLDIDEVVIWEKLLKKEKRFVEREKVPVF